MLLRNTLTSLLFLYHHACYVPDPAVSAFPYSNHLTECTPSEEMNPFYRWGQNCLPKNERSVSLPDNKELGMGSCWERCVASFLTWEKHYWFNLRYTLGEEPVCLQFILVEYQKRKFYRKNFGSGAKSWACNPSFCEAEIRRIEFQVQSGQVVQKDPSFLPAGALAVLQ
jgi:hypothetical protein